MIGKKRLKERLIKKANMSNNCWEWMGAKDNNGYGIISALHGKAPMKAHRAMFHITYGEIPIGMNVCHKCDNPGCVRPDHLFLGTQKDNMMDASRKGRLNPNSLLNLRPGAKGCYGAGPIKGGK